MSSAAHLEPWSYPVPHLEEQAQIWHARRFAAWLLRAGAEPRFGLLLASGATAIARWMLLLDEQGVEVVRTRSALDRPLPRLLTQHRGDHFNRKLFLVEGLDELAAEASESEREAHWRTLEGQRSQLKQSATWAVLVMRRPETLRDALMWAPRLMESVTRACWVWDASERSTSAPRLDSSRLISTSSPHALIYSAFCAAASYGEPLDHRDLGRIARCGYPKPPKRADARWKWGYRLWRGEARDPNAARFGQVGVTEALSDQVTPDDAVWALMGRAEAATPARRAQWIERAQSSGDVWLVDSSASLPEPAELSEVSRRVLRSLRAWDTQAGDQAGNQAEIGVELPPLSDLERLESELQVNIASLAPPQDRLTWRLISYIGEVLTRAYAASEDLEGCLRVNAWLSAETSAWPEVRFCAAERSLELALFIQDYALARQVVEHLETLDIMLASPHFAARYLRAKASQLGALDPARGVWEREEAQRLEERFGLVMST